MGRCPCVPATPNPGFSRLVDGLNTNKRISFWGKVSGCLCIPFFCAGLFCCSTAFVLDALINALREVVAMYGIPTLIQLRQKIDHEHKVFMDACTKIIQTTDSRFIVPRLRLIDAIRKTDGAIGAIIKDSSLSVDLTFDKEVIAGRTQFVRDVYLEYIAQGGNPSIVIYGLPEYMAMMMDVTADYMTRMYRDMTGDTQLYRLVMQHKEKAGF